MGELNRKTFTAGCYFVRRLQFCDGLCKHAVEGVVIMCWVMMKGRKVFDTAQLGELEGMPDAAVTKADAVPIFIVGVLRIVDQQVGSFRQLIA